MISVAQALEDLFALVKPLGVETVPLAAAAGRTLALDVTARRDQPPFFGSAMDGYAIKSTEAKIGATFRIVGEAAAGHRFDAALKAGEAVRIFTGAPVPEGADHVVIQEDIDRDGDTITISNRYSPAPNIRAKGSDFKVGQAVTAPRRLRSADIALLAAMNIAEVAVARRPDIALISTGDELVMPGEVPGPNQIIVSNTFGLKALLEHHGAVVHMLPIARDTESALKTVFDLAKDADLVVTIGGASVGDHDLVGKVAADIGMKRTFYKVAMRPGKPLMAGQMNDQVMIGLPGNPVSAMVCGHVFLRPVIDAMLGFAPTQTERHTARLCRGISANGPREHYMRARLSPDGLRIFENQDSAVLSLFADANALVIRPPDAPAAKDGDPVEYILI